MAEDSGDRPEHIGWKQRFTEAVCANGRETLEVLGSTFRDHVRSLPLSYIAIHSTRKGPLEIIGASSVFMDQFHYSLLEQVTFDNVFVGPEKLVHHKDIERALKSPLHRAFSVPLIDGSGDRNEVLVYVAKRGVSTKDVPISYFPSRRKERHYYIFLEMNQVGVVRRDKHQCFTGCKYEYQRNPSTPYECMVKAQAQSLEKLNRKGDRAVIWDLPLINP